MIDENAPTSPPVVVPRLRSARLHLRELRAPDFEMFAVHHADPESTAYTGGVLERRLAWRSFCSCAGGWMIHGAGWWALEDLGSGRIVGAVGAFYRATAPDLEAGWLLFREFWGQGYAVEAVGRVIEHAFDVRGVPRVTATIDHGNARSQRVATRLGFEPVEDTELFGKPVGRWMLQPERRVTAGR
jgi:RimJ/RimL family protein N-acetyltransferase